MIKNKLYIGLAFMLAFLMACEDEPGDFFEYEKAFTEITFENYAGFAADFTSIDDIEITVNSSNEAVDQLQVVRNLQFTGEDGTTVMVRDAIGTVNLTNGQGTLDISLDEALAESGGATAENLSGLSLDFIAEQNGQTTYRRFEINVVDPLTIEGPTAGYNDSVATFSYDISTFNEIVQSIAFFTQREGEDDFGVADATFPVNSLTGQDDFLFNLPAERDLPVGSVLTVRAVVTTDQGRTFTIDREVTIEAIPLGEAQETTLSVNDRGFSLIDQTDTTAAEADVLLDVQGGLVGGERLVLRSGADSNSEFVKASADVAFGSANFQQIRNEFEAGVAAGESMDLIDLSTSPSDAVYIVKLGNVPGDAAEDSRRYAVFRVADLTIADPLEESTATIEYRVKAE